MASIGQRSMTLNSVTLLQQTSGNCGYYPSDMSMRKLGRQRQSLSSFRGTNYNSFPSTIFSAPPRSPCFYLLHHSSQLIVCAASRQVRKKVQLFAIGNLILSHFRLDKCYLICLAASSLFRRGLPYFKLLGEHPLKLLVSLIAHHPNGVVSSPSPSWTFFRVIDSPRGSHWLRAM